MDFDDFLVSVFIMEFLQKDERLWLFDSPREK